MDFEKGSMKKWNFWKFIQAIIILIPYLLFVYYIFKSYIDFEEGKTGINQVMLLVSELPTPAVTVCSKVEKVKNET